jgi:hypothetical protein
LALFFRRTPVFGPETLEIGFVLHGADTAGAYLVKRISHLGPPVAVPFFGIGISGLFHISGFGFRICEPPPVGGDRAGL